MTALEILAGRTAQVGTLPVRRMLPSRRRRTIVPWCFIDHMGPASFEPGDCLAVPPHPRTGLQTVTWLFEGSALHRDSRGTEPMIRPGRLHVMTGGRGFTHYEEDPDGCVGDIHDMQLWVAQSSDNPSWPILVRTPRRPPCGPQGQRYRHWMTGSTRFGEVTSSLPRVT